jgi:hypothetical protein
MGQWCARIVEGGGGEVEEGLCLSDVSRSWQDTAERAREKERATLCAIFPLVMMSYEIGDNQVRLADR